MNQKQLEWRCRRGVRELDVLFTRFVELEYPKLDKSEQSAFQSLLDVQDPIIMDWLFGKSVPEDKGIIRIVTRLRDLSVY